MSQFIRQSARTRLLAACAAFAAAALVVAPVHAQILYGSIVGTVTDAQGANVPGATVTIVSKETNLTRDTVTDGEGNYTLTNVLPGSYDVKISLTGFREAQRTGVPVSIGQISRIDMPPTRARRPSRQEPSSGSTSMRSYCSGSSASARRSASSAAR